MSGPVRGQFLLPLGVGVVSLLLLDLVFAPAAIAESEVGIVVDAAPPPAVTHVVIVDAAATPKVDPAMRVPTIVAKFEKAANEPSDQAAIRALASAMIEAHSARVVLEGHSDVQGPEDYNQQISLARAEWVKSRLVELGVSPERVETVGFGATRPIRSDLGDAQVMNRRVEVRWVGKE